MKITEDSKCPLCGSGMTTFGYGHSDGEWQQQGPMSQQCKRCDLPVKLWEQIHRLQANQIEPGGGEAE